MDMSRKLLLISLNSPYTSSYTFMSNTETASKFVVLERKSAMCLKTKESRRVYRDTTTELIVACSSWRQWATPWVLTEALWLIADSSSSDEDETYNASPATTSESSESPATAAALLLFTLKGKHENSDQQSPIVASGRQQRFDVWTNGQFRRKVLLLKFSPFAEKSYRPCVCPWQVGALRKRWEIGLRLLWDSKRSQHRATQDPIFSLTTTFSPKLGLITHSLKLHRKLRPNGAR